MIRPSPAASLPYSQPASLLSIPGASQLLLSMRGPVSSTQEQTQYQNNGYQQYVPRTTVAPYHVPHRPHSIPSLDGSSSSTSSQSSNPETNQSAPQFTPRISVYTATNGISRQKIIRSINRKATHNVAEQKRRDDLRQRIDTLRYMCPNCSQVHDRESKVQVLDHAVAYITHLKRELGLCQIRQKYQEEASILSPESPSGKNM